MLTVTQSITEGNLDNIVKISSGDEIGILAGSVSTMQTFLRNSRAETANQDWIKTGYSRLNDVMRGAPTCRHLPLALLQNCRIGSMLKSEHFM